MSPYVDVTYGMHLKPGDLYAGKIVPEAPTTPLQPFARSHKLTAVTPFANDDGKWLALTAGAFELNPIRPTTQVLVIRGVTPCA